MRTRILAAVSGAVMVLGITACSDGYTNEPAAVSANEPAAVNATQPPANAAPAAKPQVLRVAQLDGFSPIVVNAKGRTIYRFEKDSSNPPQSACTGDCLKIWEPVLAPNGVQIEAGVEEDLVGLLARPDGNKQLTLNGWPLYYFHKDLQLGQTAGHGVGKVWFAISPTGAKAKSAGGGTTTDY